MNMQPKLNQTDKDFIKSALAKAADRECEIIINEILDSNEDACVVGYSFDSDEASCVYYPKDRTVFILADWQTSFPSDIKDVENYEWLTEDGKRAILVQGLPRILA